MLVITAFDLGWQHHVLTAPSMLSKARIGTSDGLPLRCSGDTCRHYLS